MFKLAKAGKDNSVIYFDEDENMTIRNGGTRAWRNNNPGNLEAGEFSSEHGSIGSAKRFAIFPTYEAGRQACAALLRGKKYSKFTLFRAVEKYAPDFENDIDQYRALLKKFTGLDIDRKIESLTNAEMEKVLDAIQRIEGFKEGKEKFIQRTRVIDTERGKRGALERYMLEDGGWVTKSEIIQLVRADRIINAVFVNANGSSYVRSRPDQTESNNFSELADD